MLKVALHNLGCKVNSYETEAMKQLLENNGYEIVPFTDKADVYIVNTCSVTNMADRKSRQMLHKAKKKNPEGVVVATGCYVQTATEKIKEDLAIDIVVGNNKKKDIVNILKEYFEDKEKSFVIDINNTDEYEDFEVATVTEHTRAHIKIQDGCNNFCSYCIIPYVLFVILIASTGLIEEMALGRAAKGGPIKAFGKCTEIRTGNKKTGEAIGVLPVLGSLALAIGYTVVVGWIFKYAFLALSGQLSAMGGDMNKIGATFGSTPRSTRKL